MEHIGKIVRKKMWDVLGEIADTQIDPTQLKEVEAATIAVFKEEGVPYTASHLKAALIGINIAYTTTDSKEVQRELCTPMMTMLKLSRDRKAAVEKAADDAIHS